MKIVLLMCANVSLFQRLRPFLCVSVFFLLRYVEHFGEALIEFERLNSQFGRFEKEEKRQLKNKR